MPYIGAGIQRFNTADSLTVNGDAEITGTVNPSGDTASGDAAAVGFTSTEGLILTGQGSTSDITVKNDADAVVFSVPTGTDDILFPDNAKAIFGAGSDLELSHNGTDSIIEGKTGDLILRTAGTESIFLQDAGGNNLAQFNDNSDVKLYHNAHEKLATTSTGIDITGTVTADGADLDGAVVINESSADVDFRVESNGNANMLFVDGGNDRVGIGTNSPTKMLDVAGDARFGDTACTVTIDDTDGVKGGSISSSIRLHASGSEVGLIGYATSVGDMGITNDGGDIAIGADQDNSDAGSVVRFLVDGSEQFRIGSALPASGNNGLYSDADGLYIVQNTSQIDTLALQSQGTITYQTNFDDGTSNADHIFKVSSTSEAMRIDSNGRLGLGNASPASILEVLDATIGGSSGEEGFRINDDAQMQSSTDNAVQFYLNDSSSSAGTHNYIAFRYQGSNIGDIDTTDNDLIRYNSFTGAHWGQFSDHSQPDLKLGTVMSTINEMCNWTEFEYTDAEGETAKTEMAGTYEIGTTHTIYIDEDGAQATGTAISHDTSKRIAKVKVSDTAGDRTVYGVFAGHYKDGDSSVESLGLGSIRIGSGVTVAIGDLLESAGDGTARPQTGDTSDLIKSSTIAKVTSTTVSHTYDDGTYLVPCVLMAG